MRQLAAYQTFECFGNAPADALARRISEAAPIEGAKVFFSRAAVFGEAMDSIDTP